MRARSCEAPMGRSRQGSGRSDLLIPPTRQEIQAARGENRIVDRVSRRALLRTPPTFRQSVSRRLFGRSASSSSRCISTNGTGPDVQQLRGPSVQVPILLAMANVVGVAVQFTVYLTAVGWVESEYAQSAGLFVRGMLNLLVPGWSVAVYATIVELVNGETSPRGGFCSVSLFTACCMGIAAVPRYEPGFVAQVMGGATVHFAILCVCVPVKMGCRGHSMKESICGLCYFLALFAVAFALFLWGCTVCMLLPVFDKRAQDYSNGLEQPQKGAVSMTPGLTLPLACHIGESVAVLVVRRLDGWLHERVPTSRPRGSWVVMLVHSVSESFRLAALWYLAILSPESSIGAVGGSELARHWLRPVRRAGRQVRGSGFDKVCSVSVRRRGAVVAPGRQTRIQGGTLHQMDPGRGPGTDFERVWLQHPFVTIFWGPIQFRPLAASEPSTWINALISSLVLNTVTRLGWHRYFVWRLACKTSIWIPEHLALVHRETKFAFGYCRFGAPIAMAGARYILSYVSRSESQCCTSEMSPYFNETVLYVWVCSFVAKLLEDTAIVFCEWSHLSAVPSWHADEYVTSFACRAKDGGLYDGSAATWYQPNLHARPLHKLDYQEDRFKSRVVHLGITSAATFLVNTAVILLISLDFLLGFAGEYVSAIQVMDWSGSVLWRPFANVQSWLEAF
ncbi:unnamed protein product [Prorocentrum cordatum]|uniref:Uncharacterized protein n=1 Tax=Prorocentrum cordatum TaxID=2364126 RepID=A0ABN9PYY3_9DINO|nr:unnamed protein product [Polarella glacialis]